MPSTNIPRRRMGFGPLRGACDGMIFVKKVEEGRDERSCHFIFG